MKKRVIRPPFFEIGPKSYLYGEAILALARAADEAADRFGVDVIFTTPYADLRLVAGATRHLHIFAPHMDPLPVGRGLADILPESVQAAGATGVMLNHCERPLSLAALQQTIVRARALGMATIVCADTIEEARAVAMLEPDIVVAEPAALIGTGQASEMAYVQASIEAVKAVNPDILVLQGAGIRNGEDVYRVIVAGAEGTGSSSGIAAAQDPTAMAVEMIASVRRAWDETHTAL